MTGALAEVIRVRIRVRGIVQGVGYRPFVHALAGEFGLAGFVGNDPAGVFAEAEGPAPAVEAFLAALLTRAPALAVVEDVDHAPLLPTGAAGFAVVASTGAGPAARRCRPTPPPATTAWPSCATRPTAATATRSSTAPPAAHASPS